MNASSEKYAVIGKPIFHSLSPYIFKEFYQNCEINNAKYFRISSDNLKEIIDFVKKFNFKGFNVTAPFKEKIIDHLDEIENNAAEISAVNTVTFNGDKLKGFNTDFMAILDLIKKYEIHKNTKTLVIGAGGAAKSVLYALKFSNFKNVSITNRTQKKAKELAKHYNFNVLNWNEIENNLKNFEAVFNTTPIIFPKINDNTIFINAVYSMEKENNNFITGKEWLLLQAIYSFGIYHKKLLSEINIKYDKINKKIISLIGFSGSGKTTIGKKLSQKFNLKFIDIDQEIENQTRKTIEQIFNENGEAEFRNIESKILKNSLDNDNSIISCGGGIIIDENNRKLLNHNSIVCWIYSDLKQCVERNNFKMKAPLNKKYDDQDNLMKKVEKLFNERLELYFETADNIILNLSDEKTVLKRLEDEINHL